MAGFKTTLVNAIKHVNGLAVTPCYESRSPIRCTI